MALSATVRTVEIALSDVDRGVYDTLDLKVAQHPSESDAYLVARLLAYALEVTEGLAFSQGLADADAPALWVKDLTGRLRAAIEIGTPDAARLHKASKAADRVAVYCHKDPYAWLKALGAATIHRVDDLELYGLPRDVVQALAERLDRRNAWSVSRVEGTIYVEVGDDTWSFDLTRLTPGA